MRSSGERELRLFVALELPESLKGSLARIQSELREKGAGRLRWVRPESIHLTLKFLGGVPQSRLREIEEALAATVKEPFSVTLRLASLGSFGGRQRLRVVWVGLEGDVEELMRLAESVERALTPLGFPGEKRAFAPHLTLARVPDDVPPEARAHLAAIIESLPSPEPSPVMLTYVSLMQSFLQPSGARYERLASFPA